MKRALWTARRGPWPEPLRPCALDETPAGIAAELAGRTFTLELAEAEGEGWCRWQGRTYRYAYAAFGDQVQVWLAGRVFRFQVSERPSTSRSATEAPGGGPLTAPVPGKVAKIHVTPGQVVEPGDRLAVIDSMKMELVLQAKSRAAVRAVRVSSGDQVQAGAVLIEFQPVSS